MDINVDLNLPGQPESVALSRSLVAHALAALGVTPECIDEIALGLTEACTNAIVHADADTEYEVQVRVAGARCTITVCDDGAGFDAEAVPDRPVDALADGGRGISIMRAVMDKVEYAAEPESGGTVLRLAKRLALGTDAPLSRLDGGDDHR